MSRINQLIARFCPDEVPYVPLSSLIQRVESIRWGDDVDAEYEYIDLSSVDRDSRKIITTETINSTTAPSRARQIVASGDVLFGATRPMLKRSALICSKFDGDVASTGFTVLRPRQDKMLPNFLFHAIGTADFYNHIEVHQRGASYPAISDSAVRKYRMPMPPLEVQREIVQVLDKFTELEAELKAELLARKIQYTYYSAHLLESSGLQNSPVKSVGELCKINRGRVISKNYLRDNPGPYPVYSSQTENDGIFGYIKTYDYDDIASITWTTDGANAGSVFLHKNKKFNITNVCGRLIVKDSSLLPEYLYFQLKHRAKQSVNIGMGNPKLMSNQMRAIRIPVPSLKEQKRISSILRKFESLMADISSGLPAEITARRKQYEYYRDKLLTFKELPE